MLLDAASTATFRAIEATFIYCYIEICQFSKIGTDKWTIYQVKFQLRIWTIHLADMLVQSKTLSAVPSSFVFHSYSSSHQMCDDGLDIYY